MDTYSKALVNYHSGRGPHAYEIIRDDGWSVSVPISEYFDDINFSEIDLLALSNCTGSVLDIGAGVGRHSMKLLRRGVNVTAVDISEHAVNIMKERGIEKTICSDVMEMPNSKFDILLMLMNGIGIVGNPDGLDIFLAKAAQLLTVKGIIVVRWFDETKLPTLLVFLLLIKLSQSLRRVTMRLLR